MQLPSILTKLTKGNKPKEYMFALLLSADHVGAALWVLKNETVDIIGKATVPYRGEWDEIVAAADRALSDAAESVPNDIRVDRVVFGLPHDYVENEKIKKEHLDGLKRLSQELSLAPAGFVVIPEAIAFFLGREEGSQPTVILVGVEKASIIVSLFKVGKLEGVVTVPRTDTITKDLEEALNAFPEVEVMPSKILLYDGEKTLTRLKEELLNHPWHAKASFLHFPKIDILPQDVTLKAVAVAGASEFNSNHALGSIVDEAAGTVEPLPQKKTVDSPGEDNQTKKPDTEEKEEEKESPPESSLSPELLDKDTEVEKEKEKEEDAGFVDASSFGFTQNADSLSQETPLDETSEARPHMEVVVTDAEPARASKIRLPKIPLPHITLPSLPGFGRPKVFFLLLIFGMFLLGGIGISAYWTFPTATVTVLVDPHAVSKELELTVDPNAQLVSTDEQSIPGKTVAVDVEGTKKTVASGKKKVGDPARGEVTVYNKTASEKTFPKGAVLAGPKDLQFTLDQSVSVASISDVIVGTPGREVAKVTSINIGSENNLPGGSDFSFKDFSLSQYAARNERSLSGGSSRDVQAVAKTDQDQLLSSLTEDLLSQAKTQMNQKLGNGDHLIDQSISEKITEKTFSSNTGEEAGDVSLTATLTAKATAYRGGDMIELAKAKISDSIPPSYNVSDKDIDLRITKAQVGSDGKVRLTANISLRLLPQIDLSAIRKTLIGKGQAEVEQYLKGISGVVGFEVVYTKKLPYQPNTLPHVLKNLTVSVQSR